MQLNDLVEEFGLDAISEKTNISPKNIELLLRKEFDELKRVKALGFISILEREYDAKFKELKEEALEYYDRHSEDAGMILSEPEVKEGRSRTKFLPIMILTILAFLVYAGWYLYTQSDEKTLSKYLHFGKPSSNVTPKVPSGDLAPSLSIEKNLEEEQKDRNQKADHKKSVKTTINNDSQPTDTTVRIVQTSLAPATQSSIQDSVSAKDTIQTEAVPLSRIAIVPDSRLWFGLVDMDTRSRKHYTVSGKFDVDVRNKHWLVATSSAPFSIETGKTSRSFNDARAHYLRLDKQGVEVLTKREYVALGGYPKW